MLIDKFINQKRNTDKAGGNKKVSCFDDYVLLYGSFKEDEMKKIISITHTLKEQHVNILPTLEYKIDTPENSLGFVKGFSLQKKANGTELFTYTMDKKSYITRLKEISNMDSSKIDKFVADWLAIKKAGLCVDPSKAENFFYTSDKISFIDLNISQINSPIKTTYLEALCVLTGLSLCKHNPPKDLISNILLKTTKAFVKQGLSLQEAQEVLSSHYIKEKTELTKFIHKVSNSQNSLAKVKKVLNTKTY